MMTQRQKLVSDLNYPYVLFKHDVLYHVSVFFLTIKSEQDNWNGRLTKKNIDVSVILAATSCVNTLVFEEA